MPLLTPFSSYPSGYWNCVHPYLPVSGELYVATGPNGLRDNLKKILSPVELYLFKDRTTYAAFNGVAAPAANAFGATLGTLAASPKAAVFTTATQNGVSVNLASTILRATITDQLGHFIDLSSGSPSTNYPKFTAALAADITYMNGLGNVVWPAGYYTQHPGKNNWQIFQAIYPSTNADIYNYQFHSKAGYNTVSDLQAVLNTRMPNTGGYATYSVFGTRQTNNGVTYEVYSSTATFPFKTTVNTSITSLPAHLKTVIQGASTAGWRFVIAETPDDYRWAPGYPAIYTPANYQLIRSHGAFTEGDQKQQAFFEKFYTSPTSTTLILNSTIASIPGTVAHESEHLNDEIIHFAITDPNFVSKFNTGVAAFNAYKATHTLNASETAFNQLFIAGPTPSELFAEMMAFKDVGSPSSLALNPADFARFFPALNTYMDAQRASQAW